MKKLLIVLIGLVIILIGVSAYKGNPPQKIESTAITQTSTPAENSISEDAYQNGRFPGFVKSVNRDQNGNVSLGIDIIQTFGGKEAFLALAEDFNNGEKVNGDWRLMQDRFKTFEELSRYVKTLTEDKFEELFYSYQDKAKKLDVPMGIFDAFPNGYGYYRNVSNKIRTYQVASSVKNVSITNSDVPINIEDFYAICKMDASQVMPYMQRKGMDNPFSCENQVFIDVSNGVINKITILFRS